ncbi:methionyl-tRNA formyltransferase, partial [Thermodesulfobacteriota bacterium]
MPGPRIVFMGTPEFAVPSLQNLIDRSEELAAVVTQPDRPVGRGQKLKASPVKALAAQHGISVLQPEKVRDAAFLEAFRKLAPDLAVVVAFGQIIPRLLLDLPPHGFINVHSSLLPGYRGASPINRAIINGDTETGVTIMQL